MAIKDLEEYSDGAFLYEPSEQVKTWDPLEEQWVNLVKRTIGQKAFLPVTYDIPEGWRDIGDTVELGIRVIEFVDTVVTLSQQLETIISAGSFGALYKIEDGDDPIGEIIPTAGTFGNVTQTTAAQRPAKITVDGIEVARTDHVDDNLDAPISEASGGLVVGTPYGWMYTPQNWGSVNSKMPLVDTSFAAYTEALTDVQLDGLLGDRKYCIFQSPDAVISTFHFYTGGPTTTIEFVGANGVTYSQGFSTNSTVSVDLGAQGLTAPVTILVPQSALADLDDGINDIRLSANNLTGTIPDWSGWTSADNIWLFNNNLAGTIPDWSGWTSGNQIHLNSNNLTGTIPDWSGWSSGNSIRLSSNNLTGTIPDWSGWTSGNTIWLDNNGLTDVAGTATPPGLTDLRLQDNALIEAAVDRVLTSLDTAGESNGYVNLSGGTNAAPSATGLSAKSNLEGRGWTVTVNT